MYTLLSQTHTQSALLWSEQNSHAAHRDIVAARGRHIGDGTTVFGRQHDLVFDERVLVHHAVDVSSGYVTPDLTQEQRGNNLLNKKCEILKLLPGILTV